MNVLIANSDFLNNSLYLSHHGTEGMQWGKRNGPPYPLNKQGRAALRKQKKADKKNAKIAKKQEARRIAEDKKKESLRANRQKLIMGGSATEVLKYKGQWTNQELEAIAKRLNIEQQLKQVSAREIKTGMDKLEDISKVVGRLNNVTNTGINAYNTFASIYNATQNNKEGTTLPIVKNGGGGKKGGKKDLLSGLTEGLVEAAINESKKKEKK